MGLDSVLTPLVGPHKDWLRILFWAWVIFVNNGYSVLRVIDRVTISPGRLTWSIWAWGSICLPGFSVQYHDKISLCQMLLHQNHNYIDSFSVSKHLPQLLTKRRNTLYACWRELHILWLEKNGLSIFLRQQRIAPCRSGRSQSWLQTKVFWLGRILISWLYAEFMHSVMHIPKHFLIIYDSLEEIIILK